MAHSGSFEKTITSTLDFTTNSTAFTINDIGFIPDYVRVDNLTVRSNAITPSTILFAELFPTSDLPTTTMTTGYDSSSNLSLDTTTEGIRVESFDENGLGELIEISSISNTGLPFVTFAEAQDASSLRNATRWLIVGATGMTQIEGMVFAVLSLASSNNLELVSTVTRNFVAPATGGFIRPILEGFPRNGAKSVVDVQSTGTQTRVTISSDYTAGLTIGQMTALAPVGRRFLFSGFASFGMKQLDGMVGTVTDQARRDPTGTLQVTFDIDSSSFDPFVFPASGVKDFNRPHITPLLSAEGKEVNTRRDLYQKSDTTVNLIINSAIAGSNGDILNIYASKTLNDLKQEDDS